MISSVPETTTLFAALADQQQQQHLALPQPPPAEQEQICYVHCSYCDTILAVGVPCSSLFKTVAVRCGHCANLLSVNLRGLLLPPAPAANQLPFGQPLLSPTSPHGQLLLDEMAFQAPPSLQQSLEPPSACVSTITSINNSSCGGTNASAMSLAPQPVKPAPQQEAATTLPKSAASSGNKPAEKRQRVPSAYNRFIKDEIQRIKASNPDITHREAFSAAAKNWAHFPHIHFGLMPDQGLKRNPMQNQDGGECMLFKDGLYAAAAAAAAASGMGIAPF